MEFDFTIPDYPEISVLSGDDREFFDIDIREADLLGFPDDIWDKVMGEFKDIISIKDCSRKNMPNEVGDNVIVFAKNDKESNSNAFFRHLRNAYSHFHVYREREFFYIVDLNDKEKDSTKRISMRGKVKVSDLKNFCFRFMELRKEMEDEYYDSISKMYE